MDTDAVIHRLEQRKGKGTWRALAERLEISPQYLSDVLRQNRHPGQKMLDALRLTKVTTYTDTLTHRVIRTEPKAVTTVAQGLQAQGRVATLLAGHSRQVSRQAYGWPFDLLVDGHIRLEVKVCSMILRRGEPFWAFNIHHHGKLSEGQVDAYVLRLEGIPFTQLPIHLLIRAPIGKTVVKVTFRNLLSGLHHRSCAAEDFRWFARTGELPPQVRSESIEIAS